MKNSYMLIAILPLIVLFVVVPGVAYANISIPGVSGFEVEVGWALCKVVFALQGTIGKALSTMAVIMLAVGAFFGKVTWGLAVTVATGIFVIFGATDIIDMFASGGGILGALGVGTTTRCWVMCGLSLINQGLSSNCSPVNIP